MSSIFGDFSNRTKYFDKLLAGQNAIWQKSVETLQCDVAAVALCQHDSYFPLASPFIDEHRKRIYALHGYIWDKSGFPPTPHEARATVARAGDRLIETGDALDSYGGGLYTLAVVDLSERRLWITGDLSGILPLYYTTTGDGFLFSSHSKLLAEVLQRRLDRVGVVQTAAFHYSIGSRTLYEGVERLNPGETLCCSLDSNKVTKRQTSRVYGSLDAYRSDDEAADALWSDYIAGMQQLSKPPGKHGVLLSGGFDTRLVVRGFSEMGKEIAGVTFGEVDNHEVKIAQKVAALAGGRTRVHVPVEDCHPSSDRVEQLVKQAESANFAYCETAASILSQEGVVSVSTGYGGETFLGGQAFAMLGSSYGSKRRLAFALSRSLGLRPSGFTTAVTSASLSEIKQAILVFHTRLLNRSAKWLASSWHSALDEARTGLEGDIDAELTRFAVSGPETMQQMCERFWLEHHVLKHFGRQEFTLTAALPIVLPTVNSPFIRRCSNLNPSRKVDHGLYLRMVKRHFGHFAEVPTSNVPIRLTHPDFILWIARAFRARRDQQLVHEYIASRGKLNGHRAGWSEFESWMRNGPFFKSVSGMFDPNVFDIEYAQARSLHVLNWEERVYSGQDFLTPVTISGLIRGLSE
ncbi:MAG: hypothetical protein KF749_02740 [Bacteroidetes bacterium]|nr:hypothetical protein [Bacteroidota bacterium]MCW5897455.1 hypothetical protein [Bacteroidota bacterium]